MDIKPATQRPELLFEVSWEVCNKIGGIYTVLSTKSAKTPQSLSVPTFGHRPIRPLGLQNATSLVCLNGQKTHISPKV